MDGEWDGGEREEGRECGREGGARAKLVFPPSFEPSLPLRLGPSLPPPTLHNITSSNVEL